MIGLVIVAGLCGAFAFFGEWYKSKSVDVSAMACCVVFVVILVVGYFVLGIR